MQRSSARFESAPPVCTNEVMSHFESEIELVDCVVSSVANVQSEAAREPVFCDKVSAPRTHFARLVDVVPDKLKDAPERFESCASKVPSLIVPLTAVAELPLTTREASAVKDTAENV